jgi:hypothetical protein
MPPTIADRTLVAIRPDGSEVLVTLAIGQPYRVSEDEWACPVALDGLYPRLVDQHGIDSWQAMQLAYQLLANLLSSFIRDGGRLLWPEAREPVQLAELIPKPYE